MEDFSKDTIVFSIVHGAALPAKASNAMGDVVELASYNRPYGPTQL